MTITMMRCNPMSEMVTLHDAMDRLLADSFVRPFGTLAETIDSNMPIDMYEENDKLIIKTPMSGVRPEYVNIDVQNSILTITGEVRREEHEPAASNGGQQGSSMGSQTQAQQKSEALKQSQQVNGQSNGRNWYLREREYIRYVRSVSLPFPVNVDQAEATMENGVLMLQLPKAEEAKQKQIQVKPK